VLALLQGVSGARAAGLRPAPNFAGFPWSHSLGHDASMDDMDSSIADRALPRFHGRLVPFVNEETRRKYGHRYLFTRSVLDAANDGQRHILTGRGLRLADALRWRNSEECLYALSHYFLHAPTDYDRAATLQVWLDGLGKDLPGDNRNRKAALPAAEAAELEAVVFGETGKALFDRLLAVWMKGYSLEAIAEVFVLAAGARIAGGAMPEAAARRILFLDASFAAFPWLRGHDGLVQVLMCALDLQGLGGAVATSSHAAGDAASLVPSSPDQAVELLARAAASRDATAAEIGFLAVAPILLGQFRRSTSARKADHLGALAAWLARPATRELSAAWQRHVQAGG
jgi:hypothetical protein